MFDIPFYTSNGEFEYHRDLKEKLKNRRDEFTTDLCRFYGTGYSTIHTNSNIHIENTEFKDFLLSKQELFDPDLEVTHCLSLIHI